MNAYEKAYHALEHKQRAMVATYYATEAKNKTMVLVNEDDGVEEGSIVSTDDDKQPHVVPPADDENCKEE